MLKLNSTLCSSDKIHQGGGVAAPIASQVLTDVLAYMDVKKDNVQEDTKMKDVVVPEIRELTVNEASKKLKEAGLKIDIKLADEQEIDKNTAVVKEQLPLPEVKVTEGSKIVVKL